MARFIVLIVNKINQNSSCQVPTGQIETAAMFVYFIIPAFAARANTSQYLTGFDKIECFSLKEIKNYVKIDKLEL